jgi:hypothetical protein
VVWLSHVPGRIQIGPFGRRTDGHSGDQLAVHIGGYGRASVPWPDYVP